MATNVVSLQVDPEQAGKTLGEAREQLGTAGGDLVLDFAAVRRLDAGALRALEELAGAAEEKTVKLVLRNVNVDVYKVLKLVKLSPRLSFLN